MDAVSKLLVSSLGLWSFVKGVRAVEFNKHFLLHIQYWMSTVINNNDVAFGQFIDYIHLQIVIFVYIQYISRFM